MGKQVEVPEKPADQSRRRTLPGASARGRWPGVSGLELVSVDGDRASLKGLETVQATEEGALAPPEGPMIAATSPRATARADAAEDMQRPVRLDQSVHLDHASVLLSLPQRRVDVRTKRENPGSGRLMPM